MAWHSLTTIREGWRAFRSCGNTPEKAYLTLPLGAPPRLPAALAEHSQQPLLFPFLSEACLLRSYFCSANPPFPPSNSPSLLLLAKMCCLQPRKPNYITLIRVSCRKQNFPIQYFSAAHKLKNTIIKKAMMHARFPNPI